MGPAIPSPFPRLCRFLAPDREGPRIGLTRDGKRVYDLTLGEAGSMGALLERDDLPPGLEGLESACDPPLDLADLTLLAPVEEQEVWAAGVTYLRSKRARMQESGFSATAYDRVYEAERPELFFKANAAKVVGPGGEVGIRADARWSVPEPELALILNSAGRVAGWTIGNDMSSRDIEGENLLYLPQAKIYRGSCALGPFITVGASEAEARDWTIGLAVERGGAVAFLGETRVNQIKRRFDELASWLFRSQQFPRGAVLLTGTGIVPPDDFTLHPGDRVRIAISGIGILENTVAVV